MKEVTLILLSIIIGIFGCAAPAESALTPEPQSIDTPTSTQEPTPTDTPRTFMQDLDCATTLRHDEAALRDLDDHYDEYVNAALVLNRIHDAEISSASVKARVSECASETAGLAYLETVGCGDILQLYDFAVDTGHESGIDASLIESVAYIGVGIEYSTRTDYEPQVSTRDVKLRVAQCRIAAE